MRCALRTIILIIIISCIALFRADAFPALKLATTTSTYETGLLDHILPRFEKENSCKVHIISVGTGKAIQLGKNGDVDILLIHAKEDEEAFVREGFGVDRRNVMHNEFIILGPENDPSEIRGMRNINKVLKRIYDTGYLFVSRGDDSGTDKKEKHLWRNAGLIPDGRWYLETGQGMNSTLRIADEKNAYVMLDRATYLFNKEKIRLRKLVEGDRSLLNFYGVIAVNPRKHPHVNYRLSMALVEWLTSRDCREMINAYRIKGNQLFYTGNEI